MFKYFDVKYNLVHPIKCPGKVILMHVRISKQLTHMLCGTATLVTAETFATSIAEDHTSKLSRISRIEVFIVHSFFQFICLHWFSLA